MAFDFRGMHYPKAVILHAVFFYVSYAVSYQGPEEILAERGVVVGHATLNRWVVKFSPLIAANNQSGPKAATANSWRMDETYLEVRGKWTYGTPEKSPAFGVVRENLIIGFGCAEVTA